MKPRILNIIICTYNRAERLSSMLRSLMDAPVPAAVQVDIIVVDNNSSDDTRATIESFGGRQNPLIRYYFEPRQGKSWALNTALRHLTGAVVAFTDDDATVDRDYYAALCRAVDKYPGYQGFGGIVEPIFPPTLPDWLDLTGRLEFLKSAFVDRRDGVVEAPYAELGGPALYPGGCNMFFRREAIELNGEFRVDLGPLGDQLGFDEDSEYCRRLAARGFPFMFVPSVIVRHPVYPERLAWDYLLNWRYRCGRSWAIGRRDAELQGPLILGIPRYLFRKCLTDALGTLLSIGSRKDSAYYQFSLAYTLGMMAGYWGRRN